MKWRPISEINTLKDADIVCFIQLYKGSIIDSDTNNFKWFRDHRNYGISNGYTHFIKLPKP